MPALFDSHCHILPTGRDLAALPLGNLATQEAMLAAVEERHASLPPGQWLLAVHYDQNRFPDGQHLSRADLDAISADRPILLRHQNGHASVANSAALKAAGVDEQTPDPSGGTYVRDAQGNLTGVLLETAHEYVTSAAPEPTLDDMVRDIRLAIRSMRDYGLTGACDMMTGRFHLLNELRAYRLAAEAEQDFRIGLYLQWRDVFGPRATPLDHIKAEVAAMDPSICQVSGIKIFADGAIGASTAAVREPYATTGGLGTLIYEPAKLNQMVKTAHDAGYQVAVHAIGDRAVDHVLDAFEATDEPGRHRLEHAMILDDAQIERIARLRVVVTMQPEFLHHFGAVYRRQLGEKRASRLKRMRSLKDAGVVLALNSDRPIVAGDPQVGIAAAVNHGPESLTLEETTEAYSTIGAQISGF